MRADHRTKVFCITTVATERFHQHGDAGPVLHHQFQHHLVEVRPMIPAVATRDMDDLLSRFRLTVIASIEMKTGAIEVSKARRQAQPFSGGGGYQTVEFGHPVGIERIQGPAQGIIIEMRGFDARRNQPLGGLMLKKHGHEVELLIHKAEAVEHHRLDGAPHRDNARFWTLLRSMVNDMANTQLFEHPSDKTQMIQDFTAVGAWHRHLLPSGDSTALLKLLKCNRGTAECRVVPSSVQVSASYALVAATPACPADCWNDASNSFMAAVVSWTAEACSTAVRSCSSVVAVSWAAVVVMVVILVRRVMVSRLAIHRPRR